MNTIVNISDLSDLTFMGDGVCDDKLNVAFTNFDMGDCCDASADRSLCSICRCSRQQIYIPSKWNKKNFELEYHCTAINSFFLRKLLY